MQRYTQKEELNNWRKTRMGKQTETKKIKEGKKERRYGTKNACVCVCVV